MVKNEMLDIFYFFSLNNYEIIFVQLRIAHRNETKTLLDFYEDMFESVFLLLLFIFLRDLVNANFLFLGLFILAIIFH